MAQDDGGAAARLSFAQGVKLEDGDLLGQTELGFSLTDATRRETFDFTLNTALLQSFEDGFDVELDRPTASLQFSTQSRESKLTTRLNYQISDADALIEDENTNSDTLVLDTGEREDLRASIAYDFGQESRFGGALSLSYAETTFSGTQSAELIDRTITNAGVNLRFILNDQITSFVGYSISETIRDGQQNVRTGRLTAGAEFAVNQALTAGLSVGQSVVRTSDGDTDTREAGLNYNLSLSQARPNGSLTFNIASDISETGRRTTALIGRTLETKRGSISGRIGISEGTSGTLRPLYQLSYQQALPSGSYNLSFDQAFAVDALSEEVLNSNFRAGWQYDLSRQESFLVSLAAQRSNILGGDGDTGRLDLNVSYSQALSEDWTFLARARQSWLETSDSGDDEENELFVGVQAELGWLP